MADQPLPPALTAQAWTRFHATRSRGDAWRDYAARRLVREARAVHDAGADAAMFAAALVPAVTPATDAPPDHSRSKLTRADRDLPVVLVAALDDTGGRSPSGATWAALAVRTEGFRALAAKLHTLLPPEV